MTIPANVSLSHSPVPLTSNLTKSQRRLWKKSLWLKRWKRWRMFQVREQHRMFARTRMLIEALLQSHPVQIIVPPMIRVFERFPHPSLQPRHIARRGAHRALRLQVHIRLYILLHLLHCMKSHGPAHQTPSLLPMTTALHLMPSEHFSLLLHLHVLFAHPSLSSRRHLVACHH